MPRQNPTTAGINASFPISDAISMEGIKRLHTEAATMTPAANPDRERFKLSPISRTIRNTQAAPRTVPRKGIEIPCRIREFMN